MVALHLNISTFGTKKIFQNLFTKIYRFYIRTDILHSRSIRYRSKLLGFLALYRDRRSMDIDKRSLSNRLCIGKYHTGKCPYSSIRFHLSTKRRSKTMIRYKIRAFKKILHHLIAYRTFTKFSFVSIIAEAFSTNAFPPLMAHLGRITFNALLYIIHRRSLVAIAYFAYRFHPDVKRMLKETFTEKKKKKEWIKISYRTSQCHIRISRTRSFRVGNKNFQYFYNNCNRKKVQCQLLSLMLQKPMHPRL